MTDVTQPTAAVFDSRFSIDEKVLLKLAHVELPARVLSIAFLAGKVLYTLAVYTGHLEPDMASQYGLTNSLGWDSDGAEYIRVPNIDSVFVIPTPDKVPVSILKTIQARLTKQDDFIYKEKILGVHVLSPQPERDDLVADGMFFRADKKLTWITDPFLARLGITIGWKTKRYNRGVSYDYYLFDDKTCVGNFFFIDFDPENKLPDVKALFVKNVVLVNPHVWLAPSVHGLGIASYVYKIALAKPIVLLATSQTKLGTHLWRSLLRDPAYSTVHYDVTNSSVVSSGKPHTWQLLFRKQLYKK